MALRLLIVCILFVPLSLSGAAAATAEDAGELPGWATGRATDQQLVPELQDHQDEDQDQAKRTQSTTAAASGKRAASDRALEDGDEEHWLKRGELPPRLAATLIGQTALARPATADYRLRPGDELRLVAWGGPTLSETLVLGSGGELAVPDFGVVPAAGLTAAEAQQRVTELLRSHFKNAGAVVAVVRASKQAIAVTGEVARPGFVAVPPGGTALEALTLAGGVRPEGSLRRIRLHNGSGAESTILDCYAIAFEGRLEQLQALAPGSHIHVPLAGPQVAITGAVRRPGLVELLPDQGLDAALAAAGGVGPDADPMTLRLAREETGGMRLRSLSVSELTAMPAHDGDRLLVPRTRDVIGARGLVTVRGAVRSPGAHAFRPGMTVGDLLTAAGGPLPGADTSHMLIERLLNEPQAVDLGNGARRMVFSDLVPDPSLGTPLFALDRLVVPAGADLAAQLPQVAIEGAVVDPGSKPLVPGMTASDLLRLGAGPTAAAQLESADLVRVVIDQHGSRSVRRQVLNLRLLLLGEDGPALQNGDLLVVRSRRDERVRVTLKGELRTTGELVLPSGSTLGDAVAIAGGLTGRAFPASLRLLRESERRAAEQHLAELAEQLDATIAVTQNRLHGATDPMAQEEIGRALVQQQAELSRVQRARATGRMTGVHLEEILAGNRKADVVLQDGDVIEIPAHPGTVRVLGEVLAPGSLRFEPGLRPPDAIGRSGGPTRQADEKLIYVVRANGAVVASASFKATYWDAERRRWTRSDLDGLTLQEGDTIIVPPDLRYHASARIVARDWSQVLFQVAAAVGTVALIAQ